MKCSACYAELNDGHCPDCGFSLKAIADLPPPRTDLESLAAQSAAQVQPEADATCQRLGLKTVEEKRAWFRANVGKTYKPASAEEIESKREIARKVAYGERA